MSHTTEASAMTEASTATEASAMIEASAATEASAAGRGAQSPADMRHAPTFTRLKWVSFAHSCIYTALLVCAFAIGKPQPETFVLGLTHGLLWIGMSIACIVCVRLRIVPLRLATAVAVLGGIGPFFGSFEFVREGHRRRGAAAMSVNAQ